MLVHRTKGGVSRRGSGAAAASAIVEGAAKNEKETFKITKEKERIRKRSRERKNASEKRPNDGCVFSAWQGME